MANVSEYGNHTTNQAAFCINMSFGKELHLFLVVLNICLSVTAFTWNSLILVALQKCSVRSPTKLLFRCLASTDLCVGLIMQPFYVTYLMIRESSRICRLLRTLTSIASGIFCGVSLTTLTAISVERLLALLLVMRYREVVTYTRSYSGDHTVGFLWHQSGAVFCQFLRRCRSGQHRYGIMFSYLRFLLHENLYCFQTTPETIGTK